jgi:5-methylcytosine-specific restriction endonuclease McrA
MKSISISGKRNMDKIKSLENPDIIHERASMKKVSKELISFYENHEEQISVINKLYMDVKPLENREIFIKEIEKKINGYKQQDIEKELYDKENFIDMEYVLSVLTGCRLKCHYCNECCYIIYNEVLSKTRWTVDRIDNEYGHNKGNIVIACLNCNLRRGTMDSERFKLGKQILKFIKKEFKMKSILINTIQNNKNN